MLDSIADTHTVIWYLYGDRRLSTVAKTFIENTASKGHQIGLSSIILGEIVYVLDKKHEKHDPIPVDTFTRLQEALDASNRVLVEIPFDRRIAETMFRVDRAKIANPWDRMITATALYFDLPLLCKDSAIRASGIVRTIW